MAFNKENIELNFLSCSSCETVKFTVSEDIYKDNINEAGITTAVLSIEETPYDVYSGLVTEVVTTGLSIDLASTTLNVSGILATSEISPWQYLQIKDSTDKYTIVQVYKVVDDTTIELTKAWTTPSITDGTIYNLSTEAIISEEIADGMYDISFNFDIDGISETLSENITTTQIFYCHAENYLLEGFRAIYMNLCDECNLSDYVNDLMLLESLIGGVIYAKCCPNKTAVNKIFAMIDRLCKFNLCIRC